MSLEKLQEPKQKKQVSEKVMDNLKKAQARKRELDAERKLMSSARKEELRKEKQIKNLEKKYEKLTGTNLKKKEESDDDVVVTQEPPPRPPSPPPVTERPRKIKEKPIPVQRHSIQFC